MKKILSIALLLMCSVCLFTSCEDDNDSNPVLKSPTTFVLNTPALANSLYDLANTTNVVLTCSQPDYGFPAYTAYKVQVATSADMSDYVELSSTYNTAKMEVDAAELAATLTTLFVNKGYDEDDFPMTVPVYLRARAVMKTASDADVSGTEILSNVVTLNKVYLRYSLAAVTVPENFYIVGSFCGWSWDTAVEMVPVYGTDNVFWRMVYIDGSGVKFNYARAWDGNQVGIDGINVSGDLASEIQDSGDGNIASSNPGWYLMILTVNIEGRNLVYNVQFQKPEIHFIGLLVGGWDEGLGEAFTVPTTADGEFVSPEITTTLPGNDTDGCVRMYVKVPGYDWWKSEFIVFDTTLTYRGLGGDQDRVGCTAGQHVYLHFADDTGAIK